MRATSTEHKIRLASGSDITISATHFEVTSNGSLIVFGRGGDGHPPVATLALAASTWDFIHTHILSENDFKALRRR
jgi:hypothetical protein